MTNLPTLRNYCLHYRFPRNGCKFLPNYAASHRKSPQLPS